jgi:hypothetical protein
MTPKSSAALIVALLAFGPPSIAEPATRHCGIPDDYFEVMGFLAYSIVELADQQHTSMTDLGLVLVRVSLAPACDGESLNDTNSCMHIERTSGSVDDANATFDRAVHDHSDQIVSLGWATSNEVGPGRMPVIAGMLFVPGYPVYWFPADQCVITSR